VLLGQVQIGGTPKNTAGSAVAAQNTPPGSLFMAAGRCVYL